MLLLLLLLVLRSLLLRRLQPGGLWLRRLPLGCTHPLYYEARGVATAAAAASSRSESIGEERTVPLMPLVLLLLLLLRLLAPLLLLLLRVREGRKLFPGRSVCSSFSEVYSSSSSRCCSKTSCC